MRSTFEFAVSGQKYRCTKLDAVTQAHVYRRLLPLWEVLRVLTRGQKPGEEVKVVSPEQKQEALTMATTVLSAMPDEQFNYILRHCLSVTEREDGAVWAPVYNTGAERIMYDDIGFVPLIMICFNVLRHAIGPFSLGSLTGSLGRPPAG